MSLDSFQLPQLVAQLARDGVTLWVQDGQLKFRAPRGGLAPTMRQTLLENRDALIRHLESDARDASEGANGHPLSHMQQRLWFLKQFQPGLAAYNIPITVRLRGRLDVSALESALDLVLRRHDSLRTRIFAEDGIPRCVVEPHVRLELQTQDVSAQPHPESGALDVVSQIANRPFSPIDHPLVRVLLVRIGADHHILSMVVDHLVADGLSLHILLAELFAGYERLAKGEIASLPPLSLQYADFVSWNQRRLKEGAADRALEYWKRKLKGAPPFLQLPTDKPRPPVQSYTGDRVLAQVPEELSGQLRTVARAEGATLFMVLMACFQSLLHRMTGQSDIPVGTAVANRGDGRFDQVIGFFANNIVMRGDLTGNPSMRELIARTREVALEAYAHEELQFDRLVEALAPVRSLDRSPIFQVMFVLRSERAGAREIAGLRLEPADSGLRTARFDLAVDAVEQPDGIQLSFEFNTDLFLRATVEQMVDRFLRILGAVVADRLVRLDALPVVGTQEAELLKQYGTGLQQPVSGAAFVREFVAVSRERETQVAVSCAGRSLTYAQLNAEANRIAHALRTLGVARGSKVGLCMERSERLLPALLGIQKSGAAYVPLDPGFPAERLQYMLADSGANVLLTADGAADHIDVPEQIQVLDLSQRAAALKAQPDTDPAVAIQPQDAAYVIYTSGSTGRPKGVAVPHGALLNFLRSMAREPGLTEQDVLAAVTTISFDIAGLELYLPLLVGARIELISREESIDGQALAARLSRSGATVLQATPATWRLLIESGWSAAQGFRALCGGEALPQQLASDLLGRVGELWNLYGPTETTIWSTLERVRAGEPITVGRPIANTQVYVLGASMERMPVGSPGEIWIGGDGVALGYHGRPELTAERFVSDPFSSSAGARLYRTGDLGRWTREGRLEHLGRADGQVKIRGYRIELGEIEAVMERCAGVRQAAVAVRNAGTGNERLVGCVVLSADAQEVLAGLRTRLRETLPEYMVPQELIELDALPLTANGKIDRKIIAANIASGAGPEAGDDTPPATGSEQKVWQAFSEVLERGAFGTHMSFFDLGGHSLAAARLMARLRNAFNTDLPLRLLFEQPTVAGLAALIDRNAVAGEAGITSTPRSLVRLQPGTDPEQVPVFALPGHNGDVFCYRAFAAGLTGAVFAVQPPGVDGHATPLSDLESLTDYLLEQIVAVRPEGHCIVMGYCAGGTVAAQLARKMEARGQLKALVLIGSQHPRHYRPLASLRTTWRWLASRMGHHASALRAAGLGGSLRYLVERLRDLRSGPGPASRTTGTQPADPLIAIREHIEQATLQAIRGYRGGTMLRAPVRLLVPPVLWYRKPNEVLDAWREAGTDVRVLICEVSDQGDEMLQPPHVTAVLEQYRRVLASL